MLLNRLSIKGKRKLFAVISFASLCAAIALGFANKHFSERRATAGSADVLIRNEREARKS